MGIFETNCQLSSENAGFSGFKDIGLKEVSRKHSRKTEAEVTAPTSQSYMNKNPLIVSSFICFQCSNCKEGRNKLVA